MIATLVWNALWQGAILVACTSIVLRLVLVEALLFWNPWIHLAGRRLAIEREAACDDWALDRVGESRDYVAAASKNALVARIERLVSGRPIDLHLNYFVLGGLTSFFGLITALAQLLVPAPAQAHEAATNQAGAIVAASCKDPDVDVKATNPMQPQLPKSQWPPHQVEAIVAVTVTTSGKAAGARIYRSSGDSNVDRAVVAAAQRSTYSPKVVSCVPVQSTYLFRANFGP